MVQKAKPTFFQKDTLLKVLLRYSVFDTSNTLLVMRPYQIAATERILWKIGGSHQAIIERFGRYPHRNAILGRPSTPEELVFLSEPGSGF